MRVESIKHAAIKGEQGMIFLGKSHADCFHQASHCGSKISRLACDQGFFTSTGRFVNRTEAFKIAVAAKQIDFSYSGILFSEMLWSPRDYGQYTYDSIKGYFKDE